MKSVRKDLLLGCLAGLLSTLFLLNFSPAVAQEQNKQEPMQVRPIPGITTEDSYPNGCVDCHINYTEMNLDTRFRTMMDQWNEKVEPRLLEDAKASGGREITLQGSHPRVTGVLEDIPEMCIACHENEPKYSPPFAPMIHRIHLSRGQDNHFLTVFQGECTHCHKLDLQTGLWTMPSANEK